MDKLIVITWTAFQETLRRRVFYIVALLALLVISAISSEMFFMRMAKKAGETDMILNIGRQIVQGIFGIWDFAVLFLALFLGAIAVSSEISAKTIVHVMSRPVQRWVYLVSRWVGILIFLFAFLTIGTMGALGVSAWLHVPFASTVWFAIAEVYVRAVFYSGIALGLSVFMPPVLAGVLTFLLSILPAILGSAIHDPRWMYRLPALIGYYLAPAHMPVNLMEESFAKERLHTDYALYVRVLVENLCYTIAVVLIAAVIFRRREVRVR